MSDREPKDRDDHERSLVGIGILAVLGLFLVLSLGAAGYVLSCMHFPKGMDQELVLALAHLREQEAALKQQRQAAAQANTQEPKPESEQEAKTEKEDLLPRPPKSKEVIDSERFEFILSFWKKKFPGDAFEGFGISIVDGPHHTRHHVRVPIECEAFYLHDYDVKFLQTAAKHVDPLRSGVADDLLTLRSGKRVKRPGNVRFTRGGLASPVVECADYVVTVTHSPR